MKKRIVTGICMAMVAAAYADVASLTSANDTYLRDGFGYGSTGSTTNMDFRFDFTSYFQFDMSSLGNITVNSATLTLHKLANVRNDTMVGGRVETYGLNDIAGNTEQNWDESAGGWSSVVGEDHGLDFRNVGNDWLAGTGAVAANLTNLDAETGANVTESVIDSFTTFVLSGADVDAFVDARASDDGLVTFLVENPLTDGRGWGWATKEHADSGLHPTLTLDYTVVPEPATIGLMGIFGLGAFIARRFRI